MRWWNRLTQRVREFFTDTPDTPKGDSQFTPSDDSDYVDLTPEPRPAQDLPPGWKFEGLYYGDRDPSNRKVINKDPSDYEIATADDVIVSYTDALGVVYRPVHGAKSRKDVGRLILRTIMVVSPPR